MRDKGWFVDSDFDELLLEPQSLLKQESLTTALEWLDAFKPTGPLDQQLNFHALIIALMDHAFRAAVMDVYSLGGQDALFQMNRMHRRKMKHQTWLPADVRGKEEKKLEHWRNVISGAQTLNTLPEPMLIDELQRRVRRLSHPSLAVARERAAAAAARPDPYDEARLREAETAIEAKVRDAKSRAATAETKAREAEAKADARAREAQAKANARVQEAEAKADARVREAESRAAAAGTKAPDAEARASAGEGKTLAGPSALESVAENSRDSHGTSGTKRKLSDGGFGAGSSSETREREPGDESGEQVLQRGGKQLKAERLEETIEEASGDLHTTDDGALPEGSTHASSPTVAEAASAPAMGSAMDAPGAALVGASEQPDPSPTDQSIRPEPNEPAASAGPIEMRPKSDMAVGTLRPTARKGVASAPDAQNSPDVWGGDVAPLLTLLHKGGAHKKGAGSDQDPSQMGVAQLLAFPIFSKSKKASNAAPGGPGGAGGSGAAAADAAGSEVAAKSKSHKKPMEVLLVMHRNGTLTGFSRAKPNAKAVSKALLPDGDASTDSCQGMRPGLALERLSGGGGKPLLPARSKEGDFRPSVTKIWRIDLMLVCVAGSFNAYHIPYDEVLKSGRGLYELEGEREQKPGKDNYHVRLQPATQLLLQSPWALLGLPCFDPTSYTQKTFKQRLPSAIVKEDLAQCVALHPRDLNLYAFALPGSRLLIKHLAFQEMHQEIGGDELEEAAQGPHGVSAAVSNEKLLPPALVFFSCSGKKLVWVKAVRTVRNDIEWVLETYVVPPAAVDPTSRYQDDKDALKKKREEDEKKDESWYDDHMENLRGNHLINDIAFSTSSLEHGHPFMAVARPPNTEEVKKRHQNKLFKEKAALLWDHCLQQWTINEGAVLCDAEWPPRQTGPAGATVAGARGMRCLLHLDWPPTDLAPESIDGAEPVTLPTDGLPLAGLPSDLSQGSHGRFWLVGTTEDIIHVLRSEDLSHVSSFRLTTQTHTTTGTGAGTGTGTGTTGSGGGRDGLGGSRPEPLGIESLAVLHPGLHAHTTQSEPSRQDTRTALAYSVLCAGFADGSVRQYSLCGLLKSYTTASGPPIESARAEASRR